MYATQRFSGSIVSSKDCIIMGDSWVLTWWIAINVQKNVSCKISQTCAPVFFFALFSWGMTYLDTRHYCHFQNCWHCRTMWTFWAIYSHNFKLIVSPSNQVRFTWFFNGNLSISLPTGHGNNNWEFWLLIGCFGLGTCARTLMNYNIQMGSSFIFR